mgnify:FL=1
MSELQERRYKEVTPEKTVEKLKGILKNLGIEIEEKWSEKSSVDTYSLRLCIKGTDIGQNGKGMTKEFAMASAYAEFFERLQNGMFRFRMEKPNAEIPFINAPDEKKLDADELLNGNNSFFENILNENGKKNVSLQEKKDFIKKVLVEDSNIVKKQEYMSLPYYSVKNNDVEYIPDKLFSYLYDTNGMCAGNSKEEALIEGLSEILERYSGIKIFKEKLTLPEIPMEYIEKFPKVKAMVEKLKNNEEYYFRLVDCSFGGKYPVAGLYIIEKNTGKFGFKMGAHPDYGIAMERCFTEAAQGRDIYEYAETCLFDFYTGEDINSRSLTEFIFADLASVPFQVIGDKADFEFTPMPDVSNLDNKQILKDMVKTILNEGKDIMIRDVSVLGFPAFSIAIPGMSEVSFDTKAEYFNIFITMQELLKDIESINNQNIKDVIKMMEIIVDEIGYEKMSILISLKDNTILPCERIGLGAKYFLAICYIMDKQFNKAAKILENLTFLTDSLSENPVEKIMCKAVYYYASAMDKLQNHDKAMYYINLLFDETISMCIDESFKESKNILINHYNISEEDYVDNDDSFYLPFMKKFREAQKDNNIDQICNREIFID